MYLVRMSIEILYESDVIIDFWNFTVRSNTVNVLHLQSVLQTVETLGSVTSSTPVCTTVLGYTLVVTKDYDCSLP